MTDARAREVLDEWIGPPGPDGKASPEKSRRWWMKDPTFDAFLRERYGSLIEQAIEGGLEAWEDDPHDALALVLLLDQMSRNVHRDTERMYAGDARALALAERLVDSGDVRALLPVERYFVFMPFMHAEDVARQRRCVELFAAMAEGTEGPLREIFASGKEYALRHLEIVERFGRFPHRNSVLGRTSTGEEVEFLKQPGSSF